MKGQASGVAVLVSGNAMTLNHCHSMILVGKPDGRCQAVADGPDPALRP
jgi:hypothetical protein